MDIKNFETLILSELKAVTERIIEQNPSPHISAKSRAGAEISALLEEQFVKLTYNHPYLKKSEASPAGATKNPWDAKTYFSLNGHEELIWIDFKAVKVSGADSNPDIGTPDKIISLISQGYFYLVYIFVYYEETSEGLRFVKNQDGHFVKIYFLKDISSTFRRNPKNQLQVNISAPPEERTREEFINVLFNKIKESHKRQILISTKILKKLEEENIESRLLEINKQSEEKIKNL